MNPYIEKLKSYVAEQDPNFGGCDVHSLVELLYEWYTHFNPICSEQIHAAFKALDDLSFRGAVCDIRKLPENPSALIGEITRGISAEDRERLAALSAGHFDQLSSILNSPE